MIDKEYTTRLRRTAKGYDNGGILGMVINECADKIDELEKRIAELEEAFDKACKLSNNVNGSLDAFEHELRIAIGHTNYNCIKERLYAFKAVRKALEKGDEG